MTQGHELPPMLRQFRQTVASGLVAGLIDYAVSRGADRGLLLAVAGLPPDQAIDPNRRMPLEHYVSVTRQAKRLCNDPALAISYAAAHAFDNLSIVGLVAYASPTIRDALVQLNRYGRLVTDLNIVGDDRFTLSQEKDGIWLTDNRLDQPPFPECTETTFIWFIRAAHERSKEPYCSMVEVTHTDPGTRAAFERSIGAPIRFGASRNAMRVTEAWLDYSINKYPTYAFGVFCAHADLLLQELDTARSFTSQVERLILPTLHTGMVTAEGTARELGISEQKLYRALRAEGTCFEQVLAELRHRFAKGYLAEGRVSLKEVTYLLGYSDVSAFSRAFKQREGVPPGAYSRAVRARVCRSAAASSD